MHEMSFMAEAFRHINSAAIQHQLQYVNKVVLVLGELTCVDKNALEFAYIVLSKDSIAEGAELVIKLIKARAYCEACGDLFVINHFSRICPACGEKDIKVISGYELYLAEIEGIEKR